MLTNWSKPSSTFAPTQLAPGKQTNAPRSLTRAELMYRVKNKSCLAQGILWETLYLDGDIEARQNYNALIACSECQHLAMAINTWNLPPNWDTVASNMAKLKPGLSYELYIAETVNKSRIYWYPDQNRNFNFAAMCPKPKETHLGVQDTCTPSVTMPEFRNYVLFLTREALRRGVQSFRIGILSDMDKTMQFGGLAAAMRQVAASERKAIVIGGQTNDITNQAYLGNFDFIIGGIYLNRDGTLDSGPCEDSRDWNPAKGAWGAYCQALMWHPNYASKVNNNVVLELDIYGQDDDLHRFVGLSQKTRAAFLTDRYRSFTRMGMGFSLPLRQILAGGSSGQCYGYNQYVYSPNLEYTCKEEEVINPLLRGAMQ
jgi:hypothetical protein